MAFKRGNDWRSQPRDRDTGRFAPRAHEFAPRSEILRLRLTKSERRMIEDAADQADMSMTAFVIHAIRRLAPPPIGGKRQEPPISAHQKQLVRRMRGTGRRF